MFIKEIIEMPMQCPNCKALNKDTSTKCEACGYSLLSDLEDRKPEALARKPDTMPEALARKPDTMPEDQSGADAHNRELKTLVTVRRKTLPEDQVKSTVDVGKPETVPGFPKKPADGYTRTLGGIPFWETHNFFVGIITSLRDEVKTKTKEEKSNIRFIPVIGKRFAAYGVSEAKIHYWLFLLQRTNENWQPLKDSKGFLCPTVEVMFYYSKELHGPTLEEGSCVVVRGKQRKGTIEAKEIWNLSPGSELPVHDSRQVFHGQVTIVELRQAQDMRYPGQRYLEVLSFRLQRTDEHFKQIFKDRQGNLLKPLQVEIRAQSISGLPHEGDRVEVSGQLVRGTLYTKEVHNHSTGADLLVKEWAGVP